MVTMATLEQSLIWATMSAPSLFRIHFLFDQAFVSGAMLTNTKERVPMWKVT